MFYLTSCDAKAVRRTSWGLGIHTSDRYFDQEHFAINQKSLQVMTQSVFFMFFFTLTVDLYSTFITTSTHEVLESPCEVS